MSCLLHNQTSLPHAATMAILQFAPHTSLVQPAFWHELTRLKIDVLKLSQDSIPLIASYGPGRSVTDRESGKEIALGGSISISGDGFNPNAKCAISFSGKHMLIKVRVPQHAALAHGNLINYNTVEDFKAADKSALFSESVDAASHLLTDLFYILIRSNYRYGILFNHQEMYPSFHGFFSSRLQTLRNTSTW